MKYCEHDTYIIKKLLNKIEEIMIEGHIVEGQSSQHNGTHRNISEHVIMWIIMKLWMCTSLEIPVF